MYDVVDRDNAKAFSGEHDDADDGGNSADGSDRNRDAMTYDESPESMFAHASFDLFPLIPCRYSPVQHAYLRAHDPNASHASKAFEVVSLPVIQQAMPLENLGAEYESDAGAGMEALGHRDGVRTVHLRDV